MGVISTVAGMVFRDWVGLASTPKSYIKSVIYSMTASRHELSRLGLAGRTMPMYGGKSIDEGDNMPSTWTSAVMVARYFSRQGPAESGTATSDAGRRYKGALR
jgi:hypothetical protein